MTLPWVGALALAAAVFSSALAVVYVKHMTRMTFVQLQGLEHERDALQVEWSKLQLELGTWASHDRVEQVARRELRLYPPTAQETVLVRP